MTLRQAYEQVVRNELDIMVEEKGLKIPKNRMDSLAKEMADDYDFLQKVSETVEEFLEDYGENYDLFDLWD